MATQKRRVVYLSDEEWAKVGERSQAFGLSRSAYLGKLIEWRQPGPIYIETGQRGLDPIHEPAPTDPGTWSDQWMPERRPVEFRPVPKPSQRKR